MANITPSTWVTQTDLGTFSTWGELSNAKWSEQALVLWSTNAITVTVRLDIWSAVQSLTLTGWSPDVINP